MAVEQIAVFLENRQGRLADFAEVLKKNQIDLISMSIADTKDFGILRAITKDNAKAAKALRESGFTVSITNLVGIEIEDHPGGLSDVLDVISKNVDIEYLYSFARQEGQSAVILLKVPDNEKAVEILKNKGVKILENCL